MSIGKSLMMELALVMLMATNLLCARVESIKDGEDGKMSGENKEDQTMQTSPGHSHELGHNLPSRIEAIQTLDKLDDSFQLCVLRAGLRITPIRFFYKIVHSIRQNEETKGQWHHGKMPMTNPNCLDQVHQITVEMEHKIEVNVEPRDECYTAKIVYYMGVEQFTNYIHALSFSLIVEKGKSSQKHQIHLNADGSDKMSTRDLLHSGVTLDLHGMTAELGTHKYSLAIAKAHLEIPTQVAKGAFGIAKDGAINGLTALKPLAMHGIGGAFQLGKSFWNRNKVVKAVDEPHRPVEEKHHKHNEAVDEPHHSAKENEQVNKAVDQPHRSVEEKQTAEEPSSPPSTENVEPALSTPDPESFENALPNPTLPETIGEGDAKMEKAEEHFNFCIKTGSQKIKMIKGLYDLVEELSESSVHKMEKDASLKQLYIHEMAENSALGLSGKLFWAKNRALDLQPVPEESTATKACYRVNFECFKREKSVEMTSKLFNLRFILLTVEEDGFYEFKFQVGRQDQSSNDLLPANELGQNALVEVKKLEETGISLNLLSRILDFNIAVYAKATESTLPKLPEAIVNPAGVQLRVADEEFQFCVETQKQMVSHVTHLAVMAKGKIYLKIDVLYDMVQPVDGKTYRNLKDSGFGDYLEDGTKMCAKDRAIEFQTNIEQSSDGNRVCVTGRFQYYSTGDVKKDRLDNIRFNIRPKEYFKVNGKLAERYGLQTLYIGGTNKPQTVDTIMTTLVLTGDI